MALNDARDERPQLQKEEGDGGAAAAGWLAGLGVCVNGLCSAWLAVVDLAIYITN